MVSTSRNIILVILLILLPTLVLADGAVDTFIVNLINDYFVRELSIKPSELSISLLRVPDLEAAEIKQDQYRIEGGYQNVVLGQQTLWMQRESGSRLIKRYPITAEIYAYLPIPIASKKISRSSIIGRDDIRIEYYKLGRNYNRIIQSDEHVVGFLTTQMIPAGKVFKKNMLRKKPDVMSGEMLDVKLTKGVLSVDMNGIAKEDGTIGERIRVQCSGANKELTGTLNKGNQVTIALK